MSTTPQHVRDAAVATYLAGATLAAAAEQHGVSPTSVQRWVARAVKRDPELRGKRFNDPEGAPRVYTGGWVVHRGVRRPRVNLRTAIPADRPTHHLDKGDTAA